MKSFEHWMLDMTDSIVDMSEIKAPVSEEEGPKPTLNKIIYTEEMFDGAFMDYDDYDLN